MVIDAGGRAAWPWGRRMGRVLAPPWAAVPVVMVAMRLAVMVAVAVPTAARAQPAAASASASAPVPVEAFFAHPLLSEPRLSPSGRWLAVLVRGDRPRNVLGLIDLDQPGAPKVLAAFSDMDITQVRWVGDDRLLFNLVDLDSGSGDRSTGPGLYSVQRDSGRLRALIRLRSRPFVSDASVREERMLHPNHVLLNVPAGARREVVVGELLSSDNVSIDSIVPMWLDIDNAAVRDFDGRLPLQVTEWHFDATGQPRVAVSTRQGRRTVHWRAAGQDGWVVLDEADALSADWAPHSVGADGTLYVRRATGDEGLQTVTSFDFATGRPRADELFSAPGFDFDGGLVTERATGRTLGVRAEVDSEVTVWLDPVYKALQTEIDARLPGRVNRITCRRCDGADRLVLVESYSDRDPGSVLLWRGQPGKIELLGRARAGIDPRRMATLDLHRITARDGRGLPLWLTLPAGATADGRAPAVVLVHGGPWVRGGHWGWHELPQFLASRGFVVIEPEFRGSTGYGAAHFRAGWKQWGQTMQDDVADAVLWAAQQRHIDPSRVCIAGASYGGYSTLMGLVRHPELYRCGAAWVAVTDPMRLLEGSWWWADDVSDESRAHGLPRLLGDPQADAAMIQAHSPLAQAARIRAPVLLAFGGEDRRVPLVHGKSLRDALTAAGRPPEWTVYDDEGHGWRKLANERDFARRLEAFLVKHTQPAPAGAGAAARP